jgi:hypothetical protein
MTIEEYMKNEEPKQIKCYCGHTTMCDCSPLEESKQETTLEEAAENYADQYTWIRDFDAYTDFIAGAKWMQERMYSEEDMKLSFETGRNFQLTGEDNFNELIEQFKKK